MNEKKVLLVDDDKDFVAAQNALLTHAGFEVSCAYSGAEGYEKAAEVHPDIIIMDVNMETPNAGFDLNRKVRQDGKLKQIPIIMLTGIETYSITPQAYEMYNSMMSVGDLNLQEILKVGSNESEIGIQYHDENGKALYLSLDSFVSKANTEELLMKEIKRFIG